MSYLQLPGGILSFSKAVISFWFRVPKASIDAARAQPVPDNLEGDRNDYFPALFRTIPLVTFGSVEAAITDYGDGTGAYPTSPSYIGVDCSRSRFTSLWPNQDSLAVHLAMPNTMSFVMTPMATDGRDPPGEPQFVHSLQRKDAFYMSGKGDLPYVGGQPSILDVTANTWHHALISFDLTRSAVMRYTTAPQSAPPFAPAMLMLPNGPTFMWAFDDVDKTDYSLSPCCAQIYNTQPEGSVVIPPSPLPLKQITTNNLIEIAAGAWAFIATWNPVPIKSLNNPIGTPASAMFVDNVYHVEMAEFQLFTEVTLDTSIEANRRAFIDYERDADGIPIKDKDGKFTLIPVDPVGRPPTDDHPGGQPAPAEKLFGKRPEILLHGSSDWSDGKNTGTTGVDYSTDPPQEKPDGQFEPTGKINPYTPDPSLSTGSSTRRKASPIQPTKTPADARL